MAIKITVKGMMWFIAVMVAVLVLLIFVAEIALGLPQQSTE